MFRVIAVPNKFSVSKLASFEAGILIGVALAFVVYWLFLIHERPVFVAIDGDTVKVNRSKITGVYFRAVGIDAPEIRGAKCPAEREAGEALRDELQAAIDAGTFTAELTGKKAGFGRPVAIFKIDGEDVGKKWIKEGRAVSWTKGANENWCD